MHFDAVYPERSRGTQCKQRGFVLVYLLIGVVTLVALSGAYYFVKGSGKFIPIGKTADLR